MGQATVYMQAWGVGGTGGVSAQLYGPPYFPPILPPDNYPNWFAAGHTNLSPEGWAVAVVATANVSYTDPVSGEVTQINALPAALQITWPEPPGVPGTLFLVNAISAGTRGSYVPDQFGQPRWQVAAVNYLCEAQGALYFNADGTVTAFPPSPPAGGAPAHGAPPPDPGGGGGTGGGTGGTGGSGGPPPAAPPPPAPVPTPVALGPTLWTPEGPCAGTLWTPEDPCAATIVVVVIPVPTLGAYDALGSDLGNSLGNDLTSSGFVPDTTTG